MPSAFRRAAVLVLLPAVLCCLGCSERNHISGKVTFKGAPIPNGRIIFTPAKGVKGPTGSATITNGQYDTAAGGQGAGKGQMVVYIEAGEAGTATTKGEASGKALFPRYETTLEVTGSMTKDFDVPADAAKPKKAAGSVGP